MREEMLKRLDEIIADTIRASGGRVPTGWGRFRSELEIEHCENCRHFTRYQKAKPWGACSDWDCDVAPDFCCAHFEPKAE